MINKIPNNINNFYNINKKQYMPAFKANVAIPDKLIFKNTEIVLNSFSMILRRLYNLFYALKNKKELDKSFYKILSIDKNDIKYIRILNSFARKKAKNREIEINLEDKRILNIAKSDEACIFILNHDDGKKDPSMLGVIYTLLTNAYLKLNKANSCPRPKIIVNDDILKAMNEKQRKIYQTLGAIGVNADIFSSGNGRNSLVINKLVEEFCANKSHIILFPEGKMSMFKRFNLRDKFQPGIGGIVYKSSLHKKHVKVIPVGIAYNYYTKNFLGSLYIGKPIYFVSNLGKTYVNRANIERDYTICGYNKFFDSNTGNKNYFKMITEKGVPVFGKETGLYIADILCENLRICVEKAKQQLPQSSLNDNVIRV